MKFICKKCFEYLKEIVYLYKQNNMQVIKRVWLLVSIKRISVGAAFPKLVRFFYNRFSYLFPETKLLVSLMKGCSSNMGVYANGVNPTLRQSRKSCSDKLVINKELHTIFKRLVYCAGSVVSSRTRMCQ